MSTHLFAFNPKLWNWPSLRDDIRALERRGHLDTEWSCGRFRAIEPGSRAFMVRLGVAPKGLIGSGVVMTAPAEREHWIEAKRDAGVPSRSVMLRLDMLFEAPLITFDELEIPPWRRFRWGVRASGTRLPSALADALEPWWAERAERAIAARAPAKRKAGR
jgi:5-methylcytosine-specific restriction protein A